VHRGEGVIETDFGPMNFEKGDYIIIPRAVTYRIVPKTKDNFFFTSLIVLCGGFLNRQNKTSCVLSGVPP
ncbi:MAG: hypothetical protein AAB276_02955, partial [Pseudomonadota bacterium]